jgi:hypothetical protein
MAREKVNQGFAAAINKAGKAAWKEGKKNIKESGSFEQQPIDDGTYVATVESGRTGTDKNGNPYCALDFKVQRGEFQGVRVSKFHSVAEKGRRTYEQALGSLLTDLSRLAANVDIDELEPADVESLVEDLNDEKPVVQIGVQNSEYNGNNYINVYVNKRLEDGDAPAIGEEEGTEDPEVGDWYEYTPPKRKKAVNVEIVSVDEDEETVDLKTQDDKTFDGVAWDDLGDYIGDDIPF